VPRRKKAKSPPSTALHLIDTNVILRFLIGDDPAKAARATALLERVEHGAESVVLPDEVLTETVWTLQSFYKVPRAETAQKLSALLNFAGVRTGDQDILLQALNLYASSNADIVDCLLAARSGESGILVYTFDETDFKRLGVNWETP
jgi:predicted nucleic-acid-binding protein